MAKKKAPKQPKRAEEIPPPKTTTQEIIDAFVGRGIRPFKFWFALILFPSFLFYLQFESDIGNLRECIADVAPLMPGMAPYAPGLLKIMIPNFFKMAPAAGALAPYLKYLLKYPAFVAKSLPILVPKIDLMLKYKMIEQLGPHLKYMDHRHFAKLELILQDMMDQLEELAPYFHIIAPHIVEISLRADKLFPVIHYLLPHAEDMQEHIWWLIPFADIEGFEEFMQYLDQLAPHIDEFAPYGPQLLPYIGKMRKHIPIIIENVETLLPQLGEAVDYMDPLVYWLSDLLPIANSVGILRSKLLLKAGMPLLRFLPSVPPSAVTEIPLSLEEEEAAKFRREEAKQIIQIPKYHSVDNKIFYVVKVADKYAGEFRYSSLRQLYDYVVSLKLKRPIPEFPGKIMLTPSDEDLEKRRHDLEEFLQFVLAEPKIVETEGFTQFVREHRRWDRELPLMTSPLILKL